MSDEQDKVVSIGTAREKQKGREINRLLIEEGVQGVSEMDIIELSGPSDLASQYAECLVCHADEHPVRIGHRMVEPGIPEFHLWCTQCNMEFMDSDVVNWNQRIRSAIKGEG